MQKHLFLSNMFVQIWIIQGQAHPKCVQSVRHLSWRLQFREFACFQERKNSLLESVKGQWQKKCGFGRQKALISGHVFIFSVWY